MFIVMNGRLKLFLQARKESLINSEVPLAERSGTIFDRSKQRLLLHVIKGFAILITLSNMDFNVSAATTQTRFVGRSVCVECHEKQVTQWIGSHHDLAMQPANEKTVLGDFNNAYLNHFGVKSSFYRTKDRFMVNTEGPDGKFHDYEVKYTFGVEPLQQYLIEFPNGQLQALNIAWDARPDAQGGQRWFHLYPSEKITYDDELHWTQLNHNWNSVCADCHSTNLLKNYDPVNRTFATTWSEIDVSCEACHGPGAEHVTWAKRKPGWETLDTTKGLSLLLDERKEVRWIINPETGNAVRSKKRGSEKEIEICARCHSRRGSISSDYHYGEPLLDHYLPIVLTEGMYYADGQINDEVYVYGSFIQSKMYQAGVTCSDCHDPHSLTLRVADNGLCLQCHLAEKYDQFRHHFHKPGSKGASCVECHMPPRVYMMIDPRHDHSTRIPRPDLSVKLGTPNACNNCHQDKQPEWAAEKIRAWYGRVLTGFQSYGPIIHAARREKPGIGIALAELIRNTEIPDIARATALTLYGPYLNPTTADVLTIGLSDNNPSVRVAALVNLQYLPSEVRMRLALPMLNDPARAVRIEAAQLLASVPSEKLSTAQRLLLNNGLHEYIAAQQVNAERPEAQMNLGSLYAALGQVENAVLAYNTATELDPVFFPAYVNLADVYRSQGDESNAEKVLRHAAAVVPESAAVHHTLGLSLVRQQRKDEAIKELGLASMLNSDNAQYSYAYAIALYSSGNTDQAISVLQAAHEKHQNNLDILNALVALYRDMGNQSAARIYAEKLNTLLP